MELDILYVVASVPIVIGLFIVYETIKYNSSRKG